MLALLLTLIPIFLAVIAGLSGSPYVIRSTTSLLMWIALTQSLNTIVGYTGRIHFGHVMFFGIGAYTATLLYIHAGLPWYISIAAAPLVAALFAIAIGYPTLRLHGAYFAIATWSFAEMLKQIALNTELLGKGFGIPLPSPLNNIQILTIYALIASLSVALNVSIERSRIGRALNAIRDNETVASAVGINTTFYKVLAYTLSSIPASLAGASYAFWIGYVYAGDVFAGLKTDTMFMMLLLGGMGNYVGPLIGSIVFHVKYEILWAQIGEQLYMVLLGVFIVLIVLFMPYGLSGFLGLQTVSARKLLLTLSIKDLKSSLKM